MELSDYILKVVVSLLIVLIVVFAVLPLILRKSIGFRGFSGKGSFEIKKVSPVAKNIFIVELEIKGNTYVLCVSEKGADVIYKEDDKDNNSSSFPKSSGSGSKSDHSSD